MQPLLLVMNSEFRIQDDVFAKRKYFLYMLGVTSVIPKMALLDNVLFALVM